MAEKTKFQAIKGVRDILPPESALWNRVEQAAREVFHTFGFAEIRVPVIEQWGLFNRSIGNETDIVSKEMYEIENKLQPLKSIVIRAAEMSCFREDEENAHSPEFYAVLFTIHHQITLALDSKGLSLQDEKVVRELDALCRVSFERLRSKDPAQEIDPRNFLEQVRSLVSKLDIEDLSLRPEATASVVRAYIEHGMQVQPGNVKLYYMGPMFRRERPQKGRYRQFYQIGAEVLGPSDAPGIDAEVIEMLMAFFDRVKLKGAML